MGNERQWGAETEAILSQIDSEHPPRLLLHGCCAPCSSYVLEYLSRFFEITLLYYNPNISSYDEYRKRADEVKRLLGEMTPVHPIVYREDGWDNDRFTEMCHGMETLPEGGERCFRCYELRLRRAAQIAATEGYDWFTTTLSISPHKNADKLNEIGERLGKEYGVKHLPSDFKKKGGYQRSIALSRQYGLYRQNYCGCIYSMRGKDETLGKQ